MTDKQAIQVVTLRRPWAIAIFEYGKTVENRSWMPYRNLLGRDLWIHSGKTLDRDGVDFLRGMMGIEDPDLGHSGMLLGVVRLVACGRDRYGDDPWAMRGQCHWKLENPRRLKTPVALAGHQGIWRAELAKEQLELI